MKSFPFLLTIALAAVSCVARSETIAPLSKADLVEFSQLPAGVTVTVREGSELELDIESKGEAPATVHLFTIRAPRITTPFHAIAGEVRYEAVAGDAYLEMWSHFGATAAYFSRTLGTEGPMAKLTGDSSWRPFWLPFDASGAASRPTLLELNLHLPGRGAVHLRHLELRQGQSLEQTFGSALAWWSGRTAGLVAGLGGALLGSLCGLLEWLAARGRARTFVIAATWILIVEGAAGALTALFALGFHQPRGVWYSLLLLGALCVLVLPFRLQRYTREYRQRELRRMEALDGGAA